MSTETSQKIAEHFSKYRLRKIDKGQILIHAGDDPQYVYFIRSGKVRQYGISYRGDEIVLNVYKPGAFFPMLPIVSKIPNRYFFRAETDVTAYISPPDEAAKFLRDNPDVMYDLLIRLYSGMEGVLGRMFYLMAGSAHDRMLNELLIECRRFGEQQTDGSWFISVHMGDIASRTGLSRETASREAQKLSSSGLINVSRKGIVIADIGKLEEALGSEL